MKKFIAIITLAVLGISVGNGQAVFFSFNNEDPINLSVNEDLLSGTPTFVQSGADIVSNGQTGAAFTDSSGTIWTAGDAVAWDSGVNDTGGNYFQLNLNTTGYSDLSIRFDYRSTSTGPASFISVQYDTGSGFTNLVGAPTAMTNDSTFRAWSFDASAVSAIENVSSVAIRWNIATTGSSTGTLRIDNLQVTAIPEPASVLLFGLGSMVLLLRRRR